MQPKIKNICMALIGFFGGILNGLLGAGGGMIVVPLLNKLKIPQQKCHATSILIIWSLCFVSVALYLFFGRVNFVDALIYIPGGLVGAALGAALLTKISPRILKLAFGAFMIYSAIRLLL